MRKIDIAELDTYISRCLSTTEGPENFTQPEGVFSDIMTAHPALALALWNQFLWICNASTSLHAIMSIWASGFQMGRDFEISYAEREELKLLTLKESERDA